MPPANTLYYGDNLEVLRKHIGDESVDLIYLDPPFNSNRDYSLLFKEQSGEPAQAQIKAFTDTWRWSERAFVEFCETSRLPRLVSLVQGFVETLGRILQASSNEGEVVLDPFCGCGTAIVAAHKLNRRWIGIDITHLAIALIKHRLSDMFDLKEGKDYQAIGEPTTEAEARALAQQDRDEFQKWAIGLIPRARPFQEKKGADTGIDGVLYFVDDKGAPKKVVIQVKSGKVGVKEVRDFRGVMEREKATLGLFLTLELPTAPMMQEAEQAGYYTTPLGGLKLPKLQVRTVGELLAGAGFQIPSAALLMGVARAGRVEREESQAVLEWDERDSTSQQPIL